MNTTINSNTFNANVSIARLITNRRDATSNPLYNTVRCTFDENNMVVESNNINSSIRIDIPAEEIGMSTVENGSILLTEPVLSWLSRVEGDLSITSEEAEISLKTGDDHFELNMKSQDYQNNIFRELRTPDASCSSFTVPAKHFLAALQFCAVNACPNEQQTSCIAFHADEDVLNMYSYGERATKASSVKIKMDKKLSFKKIADASSLGKVCRGFASYTQAHNIDTLTIYVDDRGIWFEADGIRMYTQGSQIQLPDWSLLEKRFSWGDFVDVSHGAFSRAVSNVNSVSDKSRLKMAFSENSVKVYSSAVDENKVESHVPYFMGSSLPKNHEKSVVLASFVELINSLPPSNGNIRICFEKADNGQLPICVEYGPMKSVVMVQSR